VIKRSVLLFFLALATNAGQAELQQARTALMGKSKNLEVAKKLLLKVAEEGPAAIGGGEFCYAIVYLGYIEDRQGNRQAAIAWFRKALAGTGGDPGIRQVAEYGLQQPVTWIRHLEENEPIAIEPPQTIASGKGWTLLDRPPTPAPVVAMDLSPRQRTENFEGLSEAISRYYAQFAIKKIDWDEVRRRYRRQLAKVTDTQQFYDLLSRLVNELCDTHSWLENYRPRGNFAYPKVAIEFLSGRLFVTQGMGIEPGSEILVIDGVPVAGVIANTRREMKTLSSDRAEVRHAALAALRGVPGSVAALKLRAPSGKETTCSIPRDSAQGPRPSAPSRSPAFVSYYRDRSGVGYIRIASFAGREEIAGQFDLALEELKDVPALVVDVRGNQGGYGNAPMRIAGRFVERATPASISYVKSGPKIKDFAEHRFELQPQGPWPFRKRVALLVDIDTGSAGDLFVCWMRAAPNVVTIGSTTHGNLSGTGAYVQLPCGLSVRISNGYIADRDGRPIEVNGNVPDIPLEPTIADVLAGRDAVLNKAVEVLTKTNH
jgi:carboxyl-terminal processing protease